MSFQQEGVHRWKDCPYDDMSFLRDWHRHIFHFVVELEVEELDRDLEFIKVKRELQRFVRTMLSDPVEWSCETIADLTARDILKRYGDHRFVAVMVLEDGENGGRVVC